MRFLYGEQNILRALDEAEFWKHQESEHATLVPIVTPNLESHYVQILEKFNNELSAMQAEAVKFIESAVRSRGFVDRQLKTNGANFIKQCISQSENFTNLLEEMLQNSQAVHSSQPSQTVIKHMVRESKYFIGIAQLISLK